MTCQLLESVVAVHNDVMKLFQELRFVPVHAFPGSYACLRTAGVSLAGENLGVWTIPAQHGIGENVLFAFCVEEERAGVTMWRDLEPPTYYWCVYLVYNGMAVYRWS